MNEASRTVGDASVFTPPYQLTSSCTLAEDYLMVNPQAASSGQDRVAAFQLGDPDHPVGATHILVMIPDPATNVATLFHVHPDPASPGGWSTDAIPNTAGVVDFLVASLYNPANHGGDFTNVPELYCRRATGVDIYRLGADGTAWTPVDTLPWTTPLQLDNTLTDGAGNRATVYTYDPTAATISWRMTVTEYENHTVTTGTLTGLPVTFTGPVRLSVRNNVSMAVTGTQGNTAITFTPAQNSGPVGEGAGVVVASLTDQELAGVVAMDSVYNATFAVVADTAGSLYTVASDGVVTTIWDQTQLGPAGQVTELQVFGSGFPVLDLTVISDGKLWLIHQVHQPGTTIENPLDASSPLFAPATPLQAGVASASVALSPVGDDSRTVVVADTTGALAVLSQPPGGQAWAAQPVLLAGNEPEQVDTYRVQLSLTDQNGIPVTGTPVSVTAAGPVLALAGGATQLLGPTAASFVTDSYGRVVLAMVADGLATPALTVTSPQLSAPVAVSPAAGVQGFLSSQGTLHAAGYALTASTLQGATANGHPVAPNLDQNTAATAVTLMGTAINTGNGNPPPSTGRLQLGQGPTAPGSVQVGDLEISLADFGADIWHAIKTAAVDVSAIVTDAAGAIESVAVKLDGWGTAVIDATVKTIADAVNVVHGVFNQIGAAIADAVAWLREGVLQLLHDTAVLADNLYSWVLSAPAYLKQVATDYQGQIGSVLDSVKDQITTALTGPGIPQGSLADLAQPKLSDQPGQLGARPLGDSTAGVDPTQYSSNDHANWVLHKVLGELSGGISPVGGPAGQQLQSLKATFVATLTQNMGTVADDLKTFWSQIFGVSLDGKTSNPQGVKTTGVATMTAALVPLIDAFIDLVKLIIDALLALAEAAADLLQEYVFEATLGDMPLLGALLQSTPLGDLSFGKLICLIVAFPVSFIYQLSHPAGSDSLASLLPAPGRSGPGQLQVDDDAIDTVRRWLSSGAQGAWAFFDTILDVTGASGGLFAAVDIITPLVIGAVTCPGSGIPFAQIPDRDAADKWNLAAWVLNFLPPVLSAAYYLEDREVGPGEQELLRNSVEGTALISVIGFWLIVLGIVANGVSDADPGDWISTILGGITVVGGILGDDVLEDATEDGSLVIKVIVDFFGGIGAAIGMGIS